MNSASTYVTCRVVDDNEEAAAAKLREHAAVRLGGSDGLQHVETNRIDDRLTATYARVWEEPAPKPADPPQD